MTEFSALGLTEPLNRALAAAHYSRATPIQDQSIPFLLSGRYLLGVAQTGTGKTAAFVLPILQNLAAMTQTHYSPGRPKALVLAPTRELALQIGDSVKTYGKFLSIRSTTVFGGVPLGRQVNALNKGVDIVIATPGRLIDLINQKKLHLDKVEFFVLDEADRMLDMGFVNDVRKISAMLRHERQTILFSATMPAAISKLADSLLKNPVRVEVAPQSTTAERVDQRILFVEKAKKRSLLTSLLEDASISRALVFTRTKHGADRVARHLEKNKVRSGVIHGNKSQNARQRALDGFKSGDLRVLVATDIAARGIDVDDVTHVFNFDLPNDPETYVHRIGRTARGGAEGKAISFCDQDERAYLSDIEKITRSSINIDTQHPFHSEEAANAEPVKPKSPGKQKRRNVRRRSNNHNGKKTGHHSRLPEAA